MHTACIYRLVVGSGKEKNKIVVIKIFFQGWNNPSLSRMVREDLSKEIKVDLRSKNVKVVVMKVYVGRKPF